MLYSPITTAAIDVCILLLELQRVMNWKMQVQTGLAQAFRGFWSWEKTSSCLPYYTEKVCLWGSCVYPRFLAI